MSTLSPPVIPKLQSFFDEFGEELDDCNPNAHDLLAEACEKQDLQLLDDFVYYHADEMEACHPDAFDKLLVLIEETGIKF